jgi:hypothetical protein
MEIRPRTDATSTHSPLPALRVALRQETLPSPESIRDIAFLSYFS